MPVSSSKEVPVSSLKEVPVPRSPLKEISQKSALYWLHNSSIPLYLSERPGQSKNDDKKVILSPRAPRSTMTGPTSIADGVSCNVSNSSARSSPVISLDASNKTTSWFYEFEIHLRQCSSDSRWQTLVNQWVAFECLNPPSGVSGHFATRIWLTILLVSV